MKVISEPVLNYNVYSVKENTLNRKETGMTYKANIDFTGEILTGNFSWVFKKAMESLRGYLHDRLYYEYQSITILAGHMYGDAFIPDHIACCLYGHGIDHEVETHVIKVWG